MQGRERLPEARLEVQALCGVQRPATGLAPQDVGQATERRSRGAEPRTAEWLQELPASPTCVKTFHAVERLEAITPPDHVYLPGHGHRGRGPPRAPHRWQLFPRAGRRREALRACEALGGAAHTAQNVDHAVGRHRRAALPRLPQRRDRLPDTTGGVEALGTAQRPRALVGTADRVDLRWEERRDLREHPTHAATKGARGGRQGRHARRARMGCCSQCQLPDLHHCVEGARPGPRMPLDDLGKAPPVKACQKPHRSEGTRRLQAFSQCFTLFAKLQMPSG
mmetsp:Transcript_119465/g.372185  ORF Transcript_119465/g.372185 Transcript_119465/m.372185 type:complete len:280 (-) Transcript_119465:123-962(-)